MILKKRRLKISGLTLFEVVLALAVSVVIISAVTMVFQVSLKGSRSTFAKNEALQHARIAMNKILRDLRYAAKIKGSITDILEFYTRTRVNNDWKTEVILYQRNGDYLDRSVDGGSITSIAGYSLDNIRVTGLHTTLLALDAGGDLIPTGTVDDHVVAVEVELTIMDKFNNEVRLLSTASLRNT